MTRQLTEKERLEKAVRALRRKLGGFVPLISITLGTGLGHMVDMLTDAQSVPYSKIPHCPIPGASGHNGRLWWGYLQDVPVIVLQGRVHIYEGRTVNEVVFLTRVMMMLGIKRLIITHATGAVTKNLEPGDIVAVRSQIAANCPDPTAGLGMPELGVEFSPVDTAFDPTLLRVAKTCALREGVPLHFGVSHWKTGRTYETRAEGEAMARAGADVATMSTIPEVIAIAHMGATVLDLAAVTDMVANVRPEREGAVSSDEVFAASERMKEGFSRLVATIVKEIGATPNAS